MSIIEDQIADAKELRAEVEAVQEALESIQELWSDADALPTLEELKEYTVAARELRDALKEAGKIAADAGLQLLTT